VKENDWQLTEVVLKTVAKREGQQNKSFRPKCCGFWACTHYRPLHFYLCVIFNDSLCGLVLRVLGYRSGGLGSIPGTTRKKIVGLERGPHSHLSTTEELLDRKVVALVYKTENTAVWIRHANHVAPSICKSWQLLRRQAAVARSARGLRPWSFF
jgi:hypothetical protein